MCAPSCGGVAAIVHNALGIILLIIALATTGIWWGWPQSNSILLTGDLNVGLKRFCWDASAIINGHFVSGSACQPLSDLTCDDGTSIGSQPGSIMALGVISIILMVGTAVLSGFVVSAKVKPWIALIPACIAVLLLGIAQSPWSAFAHALVNCESFAGTGVGMTVTINYGWALWWVAFAFVLISAICLSIASCVGNRPPPQPAVMMMSPVMMAQPGVVMMQPGMGMPMGPQPGYPQQPGMMAYAQPQPGMPAYAQPGYPQPQPGYPQPQPDVVATGYPMAS